MNWSISVDRDRCIGSGLCVLYASGTFDQDAQAKCVVRQTITDGLEQIEAAVEACPTSTITLAVEREEQPE
jgi:ferredoxin